MKKYFFLISVAALAMTACTNESDEYVGSQESKEIAFNPLTQSQTRAISNTKYGYIDGTTFDTGWGMTVSAVDVTDGTNSFFDATNFVYNATPALWNGETHRYWPLSPVQVNFLAIAHANADNSTGVTWTTNNTSHQVQVEMSDNYAIASAQRDFIYAIGNGQVTQNGNALSFPTKVDMDFKHTQAYLIFKLKAADAASENITITNIELKNVYTQGTATIVRDDPDAYADSDVSLTWNRSAGATNAANYRSVTTTQAAISTALDDADFTEMGHLLVVPNMTTANTATDNGTTMLKISYTLNGNAYTYEYEIAEDTYDAGKKYTYNITFKLHEIFIDPVVTDWDGTSNTTNIYIPSIAYNESGVNVSIGNTEGTYTFTISDVPANGGSTYSFVEADAAADNLDFVDGAVTIVENTTTDSEKGNITLKFKSTGGADGKKHLLKLKLGDTEKMTITLNLSSTALDS